MTSQLSLLNLLDDNKLQILEKCDLGSILTLRKTCHDFRNLIDDKKPDGKIESVHIACEFGFITLTVCLQNREYFEVVYSPLAEGCRVRRMITEKEVFLTGQNHMDIFFRDFEIMMSHQKGILRWVQLKADPYVENGLVEKFHNYLKYILSEELVSLDQWKNASSEIFDFNLGMMEHCLHFKKLTVHCDGTVKDVDDIVAFKKKMHESSNLQSMTMYSVGFCWPISMSKHRRLILHNDGKELSL